MFVWFKIADWSWIGSNLIPAVAPSIIGVEDCFSAGTTFLTFYKRGLKYSSMAVKFWAKEDIPGETLSVRIEIGLISGRDVMSLQCQE